jgi:hypothetical protein
MTRYLNLNSYLLSAGEEEAGGGLLVILGSDFATLKWIAFKSIGEL